MPRRSPARRLALPAVALGAVLYFTSSWTLPWAGNFLVAREGPPRKADAALVLAGDSFGYRIMRGAELAREGFVPTVFVSGPSELYGFSEDELAIRFAVKKGAQPEWFVGLPNDANSTEDEARSMLPELKRRGIKSLLLVTSNFHTRRATRIFRKYAGRLGVSIDIHPVAAKDALYDPDRWWQSRPAQKTFLLEWTKTLTEPFGI